MRVVAEENGGTRTDGQDGTILLYFQDGSEARKIVSADGTGGAMVERAVQTACAEGLRHWSAAERERVGIRTCWHGMVIGS